MQSCLIEEFSGKDCLSVRAIGYRQPVEPGRPVCVEVTLDGDGIVHSYRLLLFAAYEDSMGLTGAGGMYLRMYPWVDYKTGSNQTSLWPLAGLLLGAALLAIIAGLSIQTRRSSGVR